MKIAFLGSKDLGLALLKALYTPADDWLVVHPDDHSDARSRLAAFEGFARDHGLQWRLARGRSEADSSLTDFAPDIAFVCGWYWLLRAEILEKVELGFWGAHNSLLPKYRGSSPLVWSLIRGEPVVGSTVFRFTPGMDDGPVLHQVKVEVTEQDSIGTVLARIEQGLLDELPAKWRDLLDGRAALQSQDEDEATYCSARLPGDGLIDWNKPAEEVRNFIRAQSEPYPGAFTFAEGRRVTVWDARPDPRTYYGIPGQVLVRSPEHVIVSCGEDSAVRLTRVSVDGRDSAPRTAFGSVGLRLQADSRAIV